MTTSTAQQELESLEEMSRLGCPKCRGQGWAVVSSSPKMPEHGTLEQESCPDCNGAGRKWEGLSRECHHWQSEDGLSSYQLEGAEIAGWCKCQGSGRVPVSIAEARCWAEDWLVNHGIRVLITDEGISFGTRQYVGNYKYTQPKTFSALPLFAAMKEAE